MNQVEEQLISALLRATEIGIKGEYSNIPRDKIGPPSRPLANIDMIRCRFETTLCQKHADLALQYLADIGLIELLLPEVALTFDFKEDAQGHHKDIWAHIKQVVIQTKPVAEQRWTALFHDIAKVQTRRYDDDGHVSFHGHPEMGAEFFDQISERFAFPHAMQEKIRFLILNHQRPSQYDTTWTESALRRFYRQMDPYLDELIDFSRADITTAFEEKRKAAWEKLDELQMRIKDLRQADETPPLLPKGMGNALLDHYQRKPGRWLGKIKEELEKEIETGKLKAAQSVDYYLKRLNTLNSVKNNEE